MKSSRRIKYREKINTSVLLRSLYEYKRYKNTPGLEFMTKYAKLSCKFNNN